MAPLLDAAQLAELEILCSCMDRLDYFELLGVPRSAAPDQIKRAFYGKSRTWHPDRFYQLADPELKRRVHQVYKRVTEAYAVLRDELKRPCYLADVVGPERQQKLRFSGTSEAEAKLHHQRQQEEQLGRSPKGRQFYAAGVADLQAERFAQAERSFKMALTYEPQNAGYKAKLQQAQERLLEQGRGSGSQFRIK